MKTRERWAGESVLEPDGERSPDASARQARPADVPLQLSAGTFYGANRRTYRDSGLILSETFYPPELKVPSHVHELPYFCLLVAGAYWEEYGRRRVAYDSRSVVFQLPKEARWGDISASGATCFHIEMCPLYLDRLREHGKVPEDAVDHHSGPLVWLATRLYKEFTREETASPLTIEGIGLEMLGALVREGRPWDRKAPGWLNQVVERLHEEFASPLTVSAVAADLDLSPVRLSRAFRKFYGESMGDYLRRIRVDEASRRLTDPDRTLAEVALDTGFADQSHLTRVFKSVTGKTPGAFRRTADRAARERRSRPAMRQRRARST